MATRKKKNEADPPTEPGTDIQVPPTSPGDTAPSDANGALADPTPPSNSGNGDRRPLHVFSYLIGPETYVQCSVWQRDAQRRDGTSFTTYDCSVRKRYRDQRDGEWKSLYSFHASELYAVQHALQQASSYITELRSADVPF